MKFNWKDKEILITGGTGSLGKTITKLLLSKYKPHGIRIFSRDELKQWEFRNLLSYEGYEDGIAWLIGDVRDKNRLDRAMNGVDIVFNTAAMKQVPACEYNPMEAIKTNIHGAENIVDCAIDNKVSTVMHISTDKAIYPINLYGATKAVAEKLFLNANNYTGGHGTKFSVCRYGNVIGSRGSIVPLFIEQSRTGCITITDERMTRFWITLEDVAQFIINACMITKGNEIFVPKMPSIKITDLVKAIDTDCKTKIIGIRKGEKLHECLITEEESIYRFEGIDFYIIYPDNKVKLSEPFIYTSDKNTFLSIEEIKKRIQPFVPEDDET